MFYVKFNQFSHHIHCQERLLVFDSTVFFGWHLARDECEWDSVHKTYELLSPLNHPDDRAEGRFVELRQLTFCVLRRLVTYQPSLLTKQFCCNSLQIPETEGASLAASHSVGFCEVSVAENSPNLYKIFEKLLIESRARPVKPRKFSVSKMIGNLRTARAQWTRF